MSVCDVKDVDYDKINHVRYRLMETLIKTETCFRNMFIEVILQFGRVDTNHFWCNWG